MNESDEHAFFGEIDSVSGQKLVTGGVVGGRENGAGASQGEEQDEGTCEDGALE